MLYIAFTRPEHTGFFRVNIKAIGRESFFNEKPYQRKSHVTQPYYSNDSFFFADQFFYHFSSVISFNIRIFVLLSSIISSSPEEPSVLSQYSSGLLMLFMAISAISESSPEP